MEWVSGNIFIRSSDSTPTLDVVEGDFHNFDHTTIVFKGAVHLKATLPDGTVIERDFSAPGHPLGLHPFFLTRSGVKHTITKLEPDTIYWCVYSHNTPQGTIGQVWDGWTEAYT